MTRIILSQKNFAGGELTPLAHFRSDSDDYKNGIKTGTNAALNSRGGISKRAGNKCLAMTKAADDAAILIEYQYTTDLGYTLELGNQYIRFFNSTGIILDPTIYTITNIAYSAGTFTVTTSISHSLIVGDTVYLSGVVSNYPSINTTINHYTITAVTSTTFAFALIISGSFTYTSGGTVSKPYEIVSPYGLSELPLVQYVQSNTELYLTSPNVAPQTLSRTTDTNWSISATTFSAPPSYEFGYFPNTTITPAATTGNGITFTAGTTTFLAGDVGRQIVSTADAGVATITKITSTTAAVCDITTAFPSTSAITANNWKLDLSPICDLIPNGTQQGAVVNVKAVYTHGYLSSPSNISAVTAANPTVVTTSSAHGLTTGDTVEINSIVGMTQINGRVFTITVVDSTNFSLNAENSTAYNTYTSGGIAQKLWTGISVAAFRSADVGRYLVVSGGVLKIITVNDATNIDCLVVKALTTQAEAGSWTLEDPVWTSVHGYPQCITLFQQRVWYASTAFLPTTLWGSQIGEYTAFGIGPNDADSINIKLTSNGPIVWLAAAKNLVFGTTDSECSLTTPSGTTLTPTNLEQIVQTFYGSSQQKVINVNKELIFIQNANNRLRTLQYQFFTDVYNSEDIAYLAEHLTESGVTQLKYAKTPEPVIYGVCNDGTLLVGIYDHDKHIVGFTPYTTDGSFKNIAVLNKNPNSLVYTIVRRHINGQYVRFVEQLSTGTGLLDTDGFLDCYSIASTPIAISSITTGSSTTITASASHGLSTGNVIILKGLVDPLASELDSTKKNISTLNQNVYTITVTSSTAFTIQDEDGNQISTAQYNSYGSSGNVFLQITQLFNLRHLEGKTVSILGDGAVQPSKTVSAGSITLAAPAGEVVVGLPYSWKVQLLEQDYNLGVGSMRGQGARWLRPQLYLLNSSIPKVNGNLVPSRKTTDLLNIKNDLFTGYVLFSGMNTGDGTQLVITSDAPLPVNILGITGTIDGSVD